jgi:hypothetical protein
MAEVNIWHCRGCGVVHMAIGEKVVNFTRAEFAEFAGAVIDINYSGWSDIDMPLSLVSAVAESETVH